MILSFRHRGLHRFFSQGSASAIPTQYINRIERILDRLDAATKPEDMDIPGFKYHRLKGDRQGAYAVTVSANWRITFEFCSDGPLNVDLEDYH